MPGPRVQSAQDSFPPHYSCQRKPRCSSRPSSPLSLYSRRLADRILEARIVLSRRREEKQFPYQKRSYLYTQATPNNVFSFCCWDARKQWAKVSAIQENLGGSMPSHRDTDYLSAKLPSDGFGDSDSSYVCVYVRVFTTYLMYSTWPSSLLSDLQICAWEVIRFRWGCKDGAFTRGLVSL